MWLFTRYGLYSIGSPDPETIVVRARRKTHLRNLQSRFPAMARSAITTASGPERRHELIVARADWAAAMAALSEEPPLDGDASLGPALLRVWEAAYGADELEPQRSLVEQAADGTILNAANLTADDVAEQKVLCPACGRKVFASWPEGWDGHAAYACDVAGSTPEERRSNFKLRYRRLFR